MADQSRLDVMELLRNGSDEHSSATAGGDTALPERQRLINQTVKMRFERGVNSILREQLERLVSDIKMLNPEAFCIQHPAEVASLLVTARAQQDPERNMPPPHPVEVYGDGASLPSFSEMMMGYIEAASKQIPSEALMFPQMRVASFLSGLDQHIARIKQTESTIEHNLREIEDAVRASPAAKQLAAIDPSSYAATHAFLRSHPELFQEAEVRGLLGEILLLVMDRSDDDGVVNDDASDIWRHVHQAHVLNCCRKMEHRSDIGRFFDRVQTPHHPVRVIFTTEVEHQYAYVLRVARDFASNMRQEQERQRQEQELQHRQLHQQQAGEQEIQTQWQNNASYSPGNSSATSSSNSPAASDGVEDYQIRIYIPSAHGNDEETRAARAVFGSLSAELQTALETLLLDEVNAVLRKMSADEAQETVAALTFVSRCSLWAG